ncbi:MAG: anaerobic ribonucleoside-triphosphate reductase activating protein [Candidatus Omnitrophica bacterium]|nr:anaerobic ribonucleoside-triphosphate reductase activating protein [Candidatus Omnitrophota bacterium]
MKIGGFQKFSLIDYPGKIAAVIFTQGCNFRCFYCHNPELIFPERFGGLYDTSEVLSFLEKRRDRLEGIVISGGEPTLQGDLIDFTGKIKKMGYSVKLDTNGTNPGVVKEMISRGLLDYIAMDIKAPLEKYNLITGAVVNLIDIKESIRIIESSGIDYNFRTTADNSFLSDKDISGITSLLLDREKYTIQEKRDLVMIAGIE